MHRDGGKREKEREGERERKRERYRETGVSVLRCDDIYLLKTSSRID